MTPALLFIVSLMLAPQQVQPRVFDVASIHAQEPGGDFRDR